ncbi:ABC transporter substrate-binding protein [Amphritea sp. HPY]|uniref:ABC transporter substrate-binding protein n=1 Tax=Amphritea sp. HPY TaxID=3421652 RepID=UPI003D7DFC29
MFIRKFLLSIAAILTLMSPLSFAEDRMKFDTQPVTNAGKPWRIGYFEGGEYSDYQKILTETIKGLMKLGWLETTEIPPQQGEQTEQMWQWLVANAKSEYIEFVPNAHYSAAWDETIREEIAARIIQRLNSQRDIDLMIAMGTWAGKELANDKHRTSTMVLSTSDPLAAGIIKSVEDSGYDHIHATLDPSRYDRQVRVFNDIVGFKNLGVAYENSENGRTYAALEVIERLAKERKFNIVRCHTLSDISDVSQAEASVVECFKELAPKVDAIYVTQQGGVNGNSIAKLVKITNQYRIPTFSMSGSVEVSKGLLLSLSQAGFRYVGEFHAGTFAKVFNGAQPNQLSQFFEEPPRMAVNLKTAEIVGFNPPLLLLGAADEIYRDIQENE